MLSIIVLFSVVDGHGGNISTDMYPLCSVFRGNEIESIKLAYIKKSIKLVSYVITSIVAKGLTKVNKMHQYTNLNRVQWTIFFPDQI